jgi:ribosomal protein L11 methyltransferase
MQQQMRLMSIIRLAVVNEEFREELFTNPDAVIERFNLSGPEAEAIRQITPEQIHRFVGALVLHHVIPIQASSRFMVVMEGVEAAVVPPLMPIYVGPELVFGNGLHATTRLCLGALEKHVKPGMRVLDVGTGTGILSIAAARLGAIEVLALDVSAEAVTASLQNVERNGFSNLIRVKEGSVEHAENFKPDIVIANLLAPILITLADRLAALVKPDGVLISSGLTRAQQPAVVKAFQANGLTVRRHGRENEWVSLSAKTSPATLNEWVKNTLRRQ